MSVVVYSRLGDLLRARGLGVRDLQRRIATDTGMEVNARALTGLANDGRVMRPDIEVAGAVAAALDVRLDDLFDVRVIPAAGGAHARNGHGDNGDDGRGDNGNDGASVEEWNPLGPAQSHRLGELRALRDERDLDEGESAELQALVDAAAHAIIERGILEIAQARGEPPDRVRAEVMAAAERSAALWADLQANPARMAEVVREAKARRRARGRSG